MMDPKFGDITKRTFLVISITTYCRLSDTIYLPAEIGIAAFSIQDGLMNNFATLIDPGMV